MNLRLKDPEKTARIATIATLTLMVCWGATLVLFPVKPFWRDEWCIIYNLKFKTACQLWGRLDYTQQFPRVYLEAIKGFTSRLGYNYFSLRFPSFLVSVATVFFSYSLMKKLYPGRKPTGYLFVLIIVSHQVFIDYLVQIKHYEMEIFLSLVALWQLLQLLGLGEGGIKRKGLYALLCASFLLAPFFSYTYPIVVMPVFFVVGIQRIMLFNKNTNGSAKRSLLLQSLPLFLCVCSIIVFYLADISQLLADQNMHQYWKFRMMGGENIWDRVFVKLWRFFAKAGSGFVFEIVFGIMGIAAFIYAAYQSLKNRSYDKDELTRLYCVMLLLLVIALFLAGQLPLGEAKFNAFTVPAISILIIFLLDSMAQRVQFRKFTGWLLAVLFIALIGNVVSAVINAATSAEYSKRVSIYLATEKAIQLAHDKKVPLFITPGVGYPDDITAVVPFVTMPTAAGVLKTFPAYKVTDTIAVYDIKDMAALKDYKGKMPAGTTTVLAGDGLDYKMVRWQQ